MAHKNKILSLLFIGCASFYLCFHIISSFSEKDDKLDIIHEMKYVKGAVLILACDRPKNLNLSLYSINEAKQSIYNDMHDLPIFISFDCKHNETINIAKSWKNIIDITILFSQSVKHIDDNDFWKVKNHWISAINRMFMEFSFDYVIYLEDDHIVSLDFFDTAHILLSYILSGFIKTYTNLDIFSICLARHFPHKNPFANFNQNNTNVLSQVFIMNGSCNIAAVHLKTNWVKFMKHIDIFCSLKNGWDIAQRSMLLTIPSLVHNSLFITKPRAYHLRGQCYSSRIGGASPLCDRRIRNYTIQQEYNLFIESFHQKKNNNWHILDNENQVQFQGKLNMYITLYGISDMH